MKQKQKIALGKEILRIVMNGLKMAVAREGQRRARNCLTGFDFSECLKHTQSRHRELDHKIKNLNLCYKYNFKREIGSVLNNSV